MNSFAFTPENGLALIEFNRNPKTSQVIPVKVHEIDFTYKIYSHRSQVNEEAKAINKTFVTNEDAQKLLRLCREICQTNGKQTEPTEKLELDYFLTIHCLATEKKPQFQCETYFQNKLEKSGKTRDLFERILEYERQTEEVR